MHERSNAMSEVFFSVCKGLDTPVSLGAWLRFRHSNKSVLDMSIDPVRYAEKDAKQFEKDYMVVSLLQKWKGLDTGLDLAAEALRKFDTSESLCAATNVRIRAMRTGKIASSAFLFEMQRQISKLLGPFSLFKLEPFFEWGPGATFDLSRRRAQMDKKMSNLPISVSPRSRELFESVIAGDRHWSRALLGHYADGPFCFMPNVFRLTDECRITTVPKSAKTDRTIAIEPTGNLYLQKGVGGYFRKRLLSAGIDLNDQSVNQELAKSACSLGLATLDLKSASDSVSKELVYELLPPEWADFLDSLRSHRALKPDGTSTTLEKFSSMGNGFTFELESLIFWALLKVSVQRGSGPFSVYGDDLILPQECAPTVIERLNSLGFEINDDKSFVSGLFFESCGKHYFNGEEVTPVYQKELVDDELEVIRLHNRLYRWSSRSGCETGACHFLRRISREVRRRRLWIPEGSEGDDGMILGRDDFLALGLPFDRNLGFRIFTVNVSKKEFPAFDLTMLSVALRRMERRGPFNLLKGPPLQGVSPYETVSVAGESILAKGVFTRRWVYPTWLTGLEDRSS